MNVTELIAAPEGKTLEFKRDLSSLAPVMKTLVAFANTAGGVLVIGIADDGALVGVDHPLAEEERLASTIADNIRPAMTPEIDLVSHQGKTLLLVRVPHWRGPFYVRAEGPQEGVYIRLGSTNRRAGPEMLAELQRSLAGLSFDQLPCPDLSADDLDVTRLERYFAAIGRTVSKEHLESLGVLVPQAGRLAPSHGGLILFGRDGPRQRLFPAARISCARFRGADRVDFLDRLDIEGTVLEALEETPKFIRRNTRLAARIVAMHRQDIPEYSEIALREVLVNAVAHADYSLSGMPIRVAIYADRLEVENPGLLPFGMTLDDFKAGVSRIRNRVIVRVLRELGLVEEWGTGYSRIIRACEESGHPLPAWRELGAVIRVNFQPHPDVSEGDDKANSITAHETINETINETVNTRQQWFLDQLGAGKQVGWTHLAQQSGVSRATARRDIADLKARGLIEFVGARKTGRYQLSGSR